MGIRAYVGQTIIDMETCDSKKIQTSPWPCEELIRKWKGHERIRPVVAPPCYKYKPAGGFKRQPMSWRNGMMFLIRFM